MGTKHLGVVQDLGTGVSAVLKGLRKQKCKKITPIHVCVRQFLGLLWYCRSLTNYTSDEEQRKTRVCQGREVDPGAFKEGKVWYVHLGSER